MNDLLSTGLLTCHGKEAAVAGSLAKVCYVIFTIHQFDTDTLGTFTGEIARKGTMLDAAKRCNHCNS